MSARAPSRLVPGALLIVGVALLGIAQVTLDRSAARSASGTDPAIREAQSRALEAQRVLHAERESLPLSEIDRDELETNDPLHTGLVGLALSPTTTTDGSLRAKRESTDPAWVRRIAALLDSAEAQDGDTVWIGASGSFPALTLAAVLACEARGLEPALIPSLTASTYGANVPGFDWLALEGALHAAGLLDHRSVAASVGGEEDRGVGLEPEAAHALRARIAESGVPLVEGADARVARWREATGEQWPRVYINIGGNHTSVGPHTEALALEPGLNTAPVADSAEGVAARMLAAGVPVIHLLHIAPLAESLDRAAVAADVPWHPWAQRGLALAGLIFIAAIVGLRLSPPGLAPRDTLETDTEGEIAA